MSGATHFTIGCAAILFFTAAAQDPAAPAAPRGETNAPRTQSAPAAAQDAAANPATAAAEARMRAAMASFLRGQSSWETAGADAQRSSWVRTDPKISREGVQKPEFRFLWKINLAEKPARANSLSSAILLNHYIGYRGFRNLAFVANEGAGIYGLDIDLGRIEWAVHDAHARASTCPAGTLNGVARSLGASFPTPAARFGSGRGGPARSAVGEPYEGAVTLAEPGRNGLRPPPAAPAPAPSPRSDANAPAVPASIARPARPPRAPAVVYALTADGMLHTMYVSNGQEPKPALPFIAPDSAARGFIVVNGVAYAAAVACTGAASSVIALDIDSGATSTWKAPSEIAGQQGPAFGPDGAVYVSTVGGDLFALDPKTLEVKDRLESGEPFSTSPVIFQYRQQALGVVAAKNGGLVLFDTKSLGGEDHHTPLFKTKPDAGRSFGSTSIASWMDNGARRWLVLPGKTSGIAATEAWQVKEQNGTLSLASGWTSHEIASPSAAIIINGVVFAVSNADAAEAGTRRRSPSVIYALDGVTGKELWNSGKAIASSAHSGSLSGGASQIYLGTDDGTLYAFGAWIER